MKKIETYSKIFSIVLYMMILICIVLTLKHIWFGEKFVTSMIFAIVFWIVSSGKRHEVAN